MEIEMEKIMKIMKIMRRITCVTSTPTMRTAMLY